MCVLYDVSILYYITLTDSMTDESKNIQMKLITV
jgi:hypothetical protein